MLRHGRAATSALLVGVLVVQTACVGSRPMGWPAPLRPEDPDQRAAIERAKLAKVRTVNDEEVWILGPRIEGQGFIGKDWRSPRAPRPDIAVPLDSIADIQLYRSDYRWLVGTAALTAVVAVLIVLASDWNYQGIGQ